MLGKPSPAYFEAALEALDAEPELTWMVGDDLDADIAGAQRYGLKTVLVRTGKFRPGRTSTARRSSPMRCSARSRTCPSGWSASP